MNVFLSSDYFNCVAFVADCKYKWSVLDLFILFCSTLIIFFQVKTQQPYQQSKNYHQNTNLNLFDWEVLFFFGWDPLTICMWTSLPCDNGTIPMRCFLDWYKTFVMLRRTNIGYWWLFAYCSINLKSNWFLLFVIAVLKPCIWREKIAESIDMMGRMFDETNACNKSETTPELIIYPKYKLPWEWELIPE